MSEIKGKPTPGPWEVCWYVCTADKDDVAHGSAEKVGDELWRAPYSIGPVEIEHNHWAGHYLEVEPADIALIAEAPEMLRILRQIEWTADTDHDFCPACGGVRSGALGHRHDCELSAVLDRIGRETG